MRSATIGRVIHGATGAVATMAILHGWPASRPIPILAGLLLVAMAWELVAQPLLARRWVWWAPYPDLWAMLACPAGGLLGLGVMRLLV